MKEAIHLWLSIACSIIVVCGLIFGAYTIGTATETHITFIVERCPAMESITDESSSVAEQALKPSRGIEITAPRPIRKPSVPK